MSASKIISDPVGAKVPSKDYAWWKDDIDHKITPELKASLSEYTGIPQEDIRIHIYTIREKAWSIRPYPCTGLGAFLTPTLPQHPSYPQILTRFKDNPQTTFLDIGCYIGQDLRSLVRAGAPQTNLYATDIVNHWDLGYEFFRDKERFQVKYFEADLLNPTESMTAELDGRVDVLWITHVLHQWDWETQVLACKQLVKFSRKGTWVVGFQGGTADAEARGGWNKEMGTPEDGFLLHGVDSFVGMWEVVGRATGTKWKTEVQVVSWKEMGGEDDEVEYLGKDFALLRFWVTRLE